MRRVHRGKALTAVAATGALVGGALLAPGVSSASSHREAPTIANDPRHDNTDVYAFVSPDDAGKVTMIANFHPFEEPNGGPTFYQFQAGSNYDINIDNNGDAIADLVYTWVFTDHLRNPNTFLYNTGPVTTLPDEDLNFFQTYDLSVRRMGGGTEMLVNDGLVAPSYVGPASMPDGYDPLRQAAITSVKHGGSSYAGQADDSFFADLRVFDLLYGAETVEGGGFAEDGNDTLAGYNVQSIALELPMSALALKGDAKRNPVIGIWSDTERQQVQVLSGLNGPGGMKSSGEDVQVSRLGNPLVNEVVIPLKDKDRWNASTPSRDAQFAKYVVDPEVPKLVEAIYKIPAPAAPRTDLVEVFLTGVCDGPGCPATLEGVDLNSQLLNADVDPKQFKAAEMLRLNMSVPATAEGNRLGVLGGDLAGFPNGRRLIDDVVDIELQVLEGELLGRPNDLGDAVSENDVPFTDDFPFVGIPHNDAVNVTAEQGGNGS